MLNCKLHLPDLVFCGQRVGRANRTRLKGTSVVREGNPVSSKSTAPLTLNTKQNALKKKQNYHLKYWSLKEWLFCVTSFKSNLTTKRVTFWPKRSNTVGIPPFPRALQTPPLHAWNALGPVILPWKHKRHQATSPTHRGKELLIESSWLVIHYYRWLKFQLPNCTILK